MLPNTTTNQPTSKAGNLFGSLSSTLGSFGSSVSTGASALGNVLSGMFRGTNTRRLPPVAQNTQATLGQMQSPLNLTTPLTPSMAQPAVNQPSPVQISVNTQPQEQPIQQAPVQDMAQSLPTPLQFAPQVTDTNGYVLSSSVGSNSTYQDVLAKRKLYEDQYQKSLLEASNIYGQGIQAVENARYSGETQPFAQGQAERVQRNADLQSLAATNRADAYGKLLGINQQNLTNTLAQQPTSLGTQINQATGDVYVTTRNPLTGQAEVVNAGNIGAQKSFVSSSVNQDPFTGQLIFTGVRQDGTVETQNLSGGTQQTGGQVPFAIQSSINYAGNTPFIDAGNLTSQQLPMAQSYSAQNGVPLLSKEDATKLKDASATFSSADSLLTTVEQYANKIITAQSTAGIPGQYLTTKLGSLFKSNPDAVVFDSSVAAFSSLLTRAAGEKGVLTDKDVARIINGLPTRTDTVASAAKKVEALRSIYQSVKDGTFASYLGAKTPQSQTTGTSIIQTKVGAVDNSWF